MGLFTKQTNAAIEQWLDTINSEEDIKKFEAQGIDMTPYRAQLEARWAGAAQADAHDQAARYGIGEVDQDAIANPIQLEKLVPYKATPRDGNSAFVLDCAGKLPLMGKDKYIKSIAEAPLVCAAVVQAHSDLWEPGKGDETMAAVFVFALDDAHRCDVEWVKSTAKAISDMKASGEVPADNREFISILRDDRSMFVFKLGQSLSGGADAWCATYSIGSKEKEVLPNGYLPDEGIVPLLITDPPVQQKYVGIKLVNAKYYT